MSKIPVYIAGRAGQGGFTLLELLVVLAIVGMVAAVVPMAFPAATARVETEAAARVLASDLRAVRRAAIAGNRSLALSFQPNGIGYSTGALTRAFPDLVRTAVEVGGENKTGSGVSIIFNPDGSSTGGDIRIFSAKAAYRVSVDWVSGRIRLSP